MTIIIYCWTCVELIVHVSAKKSSNIRQMYIHFTALYQTLSRLYHSIMHEKLSVLILISFQTILEIVLSWISPSRYREREVSLADLSELLNYEELEDENPPEISTQRRMRRVMHHYVPPNPFRATIRVRGTPTTSAMISPTSLSFLSGDRSVSGLESVVTDYMEADSPASFPSTPFSRARVMSRCYERVDSLMFAARDKLRLEAQSASRDAYSRSAAIKARSDGQYAVFDARQASDGLALTCGNHCAMKVGKGVCCSCRAMMPVPVNTLVYMEFSVTVSGAQIPSIAVGLGPPDAPLNVMIGSWPCSVGLYSDGQLLIDSRWFQSVSNNNGNLNPGTTVGFLVYLPDSSAPTRRTSSEGTSDNEQDGYEKDSNSSNSITPSSSISNALVALLSTTSANFSKTSSTPSLAKNISTPLSKANSSSHLDKTATASNLNSSPSEEMLKSNSSSIFPTSVLSLLGLSNNNSDSKTNSPIRTKKELSKSNSTSVLNSLFQSGAKSAEPDKESPQNLSDSSNNLKMEETVVGVCNLTGNPNDSTSNKFKDKKQDKKLPFIMTIHVNGARREYAQPAMDAAQEIVSLRAPLYPTVSLISENTRVWCRFCEADIVYRSRQAMGAPAGCRVYCLDGSLLLDETDE
jgi:hypothetical protein